MKKSVKKHLKLFIVASLYCSFLFPQAKLGFENYQLLTGERKNLIIPSVHYQTKKGFYTMLRYNYEDINTLSVYGGKNFNNGTAFRTDLTPMIGFSAGHFNGVSLALNADAEWKGLYISTQSQYSLPVKSNSAAFYYNWTELGFYVTEFFFTGITIQSTRTKEKMETEPGFAAGLDFKWFSIPVYFFKPLTAEPYLIVGVNMGFDLKRKIN